MTEIEASAAVALIVLKNVVLEIASHASPDHHRIN